MFAMTEAAAGYLHNVLDRANAPQEKAIRLSLDGAELTPALDTAKPGDESYDHDGRKVLLLDEQVSSLLAESVLDVHTTEAGPRLVVVG